jgi:MraZ protein
MPDLLGEYECKLDTKGRLALPAALIKQLAPLAPAQFIINRGFERHLVLYPSPAWEATIAKVHERLNEFTIEHRVFMRRFYGGAMPLTLDGQSRILLPKRLLDYAQIKDRVVLFAQGDKIEVWASELYEQMLDVDPQEFAEQAQRLLGKTPSNEAD